MTFHIRFAGYVIDEKQDELDILYSLISDGLKYLILQETKNEHAFLFIYLFILWW